MDKSKKLSLAKIANDVRIGIVESVYSAGCGHPGGSLSIADIMTYLYFEEMRVDPENPKWEVWWVAFDGYACTHILSQFQMTKPVVICPQESSALQRICYKMYSAQKTDKMYCDYSCSGYVYDYLIEFHHFMDSKLNKLRNERNKLLLPVLNYIDDNFRSDFPLTALADLAGITPQHLCRVFKETMNMRPVEYLTQKRLSEAKRLLQRNEQSIFEIAVLSGFTDVRYFSTVFKKHEGMTPMDYKKRIGVK